MQFDRIARSGASHGRRGGCDDRRVREPTRRTLAGAFFLLTLVVAAAWWWRLAGPAGIPLATPAQAAQPARAARPAAAPAVTGLRLRFASVEQGRRLLTADDEWVRYTSPLQRATLMGRTGPAPVQAFLAFQADAVLPWTDAARARWQRAYTQIAPTLERLQLPWPAEVLLVQTSGRESANQPHTRGHAVVLPQQFEQQEFSDAEVLAHELFHVLSRHRPELASRLYALLGYEPAGELEWPPQWLPLRISNQDAPLHHHVMRVTLKGRPVVLMPVVVSAAAKPAPGETLLDLMEPRLLEVVPGRGGHPTRPVLRGGEPVWHDIESTKAFLDRLGGNTDYTLHPDETIADNFMFLVAGRPVKNPGLLRRIEAVLRDARRP